MESQHFQIPTFIHGPLKPRRHEEDIASEQEIITARQQMATPSKDWTKLANILRRASGGLSRSRGPRH